MVQYLDNDFSVHCPKDVLLLSIHPHYVVVDTINNENKQRLISINIFIESKKKNKKIIIPQIV